MSLQNEADLGVTKQKRLIDYKLNVHSNSVAEFVALLRYYVPINRKKNALLGMEIVVCASHRFNFAVKTDLVSIHKLLTLLIQEWSRNLICYAWMYQHTSLKLIPHNVNFIPIIDFNDFFFFHLTNVEIHKIFNLCTTLGELDWITKSLQ